MNKSILICGGTGFLGFNYIKKLKDLNWKIYSLSTNKPKIMNKIKNIRYLICDLSDKKKIQTQLDKIKVNYVVNFSGYVDHTNRKRTFRSHFIGLKYLSNYFAKKKIIKFIQIGSSLEYEKAKSPHLESYKIKKDNLQSTYSLAKFKSTKYLIKLGQKTNLPFLILRPYLIYGPHQNNKRLIPIVINNCLKNISFPTSSGNQYRDFLYVGDFIDILYRLMINKNLKNEIINIGTGKPQKVKNVINKINKKIKKGVPLFGKIKLRKDEKKIYFPSIKRLKKILPNLKFTSLDSGLNKTIKFYEKI